MNDYPKIGAPPLQVWSKDVVDGDNNPMPAAGDEWVWKLYKSFMALLQQF